ncbi:MAG: polymerase subunit sigma [Thermoleophilia bacterium]|nr:polymerase subunit sigma [Thermoleophilia bacterium]
MQRTPEQRAAHANWMRLVAAGDAAAFETLYDEFADLVFSLAMSMLRDRGRAEDAAQDVWVKVWNAAGSFDPERASVATWLTTLAHRHLIDLLRRAKVRIADRSGAEPGDEVAARMSNDEDIAEQAIDIAYSADVRSAMAELSGDQRRSLELAYFGGYSQSEIAGILGKPLGTVKTYMFQGMRRLREILGVDLEHPAHR